MDRRGNGARTRLFKSVLQNKTNRCADAYSWKMGNTKNTSTSQYKHHVPFWCPLTLGISCALNLKTLFALNTLLYTSYFTVSLEGLFQEAILEQRGSSQSQQGEKIAGDVVGLIEITILVYVRRGSHLNIWVLACEGQHLELDLQTNRKPVLRILKYDSYIPDSPR